MITMPGDVSGALTAIGTLILAAGALVTAAFAALALRKQAQEVRTIERQVRDQAELTEQQAELIRLQVEQATLQRQQLELQRQQLEEDRAVSARQAKAMNLQIGELQMTLEEHHRYNWRWRHGQASRVFANTEIKRNETTPGRPYTYSVTSLVRNTSEQPIYDVGLWRRAADKDKDELLSSMGVIMPGDETRASFSIPMNESDGSYYVRFRDASETNWMNMPDNRLIELPSGLYERYVEHRPKGNEDLSHLDAEVY